MNRLFIGYLAFLLTTTALAQTQEPVQLTTTDLTFHGTLTLPANAKSPVPVVLLIAGSGPTDRDGNNPAGLKTNAYRQLADSLAKYNIATLRYDKRGVGQSVAPTIKEQDMTFDLFVQDAVGWARQLQADKRFSRVIIAGHSEGSLTGMVAAGQTKPAGYVSLAGIGRNINDVLKEQLKTLPEPLQSQTYRALDSLKAGQTVRQPPLALMSLLRPSVQPFMISWMKFDPAAEIKKYTGPVLIVQGKHDIQVSVNDAEQLKAARPDARLALFDQMSHVLKDAPEDRAENMKTYNQPDLPLTPGLAYTIAQFVNK